MEQEVIILYNSLFIDVNLIVLMEILCYYLFSNDKKIEKTVRNLVLLHLKLIKIVLK